MKEVEQKSHGQITFKVFEGGELVKEKFVSTAIPQDVADISLSVLERWSSRVPDFEILGSPLWTWPMSKTLTDMVPGKPVFDYLNKRLEGQGAIMLAALDIGPPVVVSNFKVRKPSDLKGHTIRVYSRGTAQIVQTLAGLPRPSGSARFTPPCSGARLTEPWAASEEPWGSNTTRLPRTCSRRWECSAPL